MSGVVERTRSQAAINPRLLPAIDQLLIAGIKLGPNKKRQAINKILQLVPDWKRGDCWRRIRQLRRTSALATPNTIQDAKEPGNNVSSYRAISRPWLPEDDDKLLDWAGYEPASKIAQRLRRSVRAVRFRLGALGMSARVKDGWSQRGLRKLLRASRARLRYLVASGMLRVPCTTRFSRIRSGFCPASRKKGVTAVIQLMVPVSGRSNPREKNSPLPGIRTDISKKAFPSRLCVCKLAWYSKVAFSMLTSVTSNSGTVIAWF